MNLSSKNKIYFIVIFFLLVLAGLGLLSRFLFGLIVEEGNKIKTIQSESMSLNQQRSQINDISKEYENIKDTVSGLDQHLLKADDKLGFIILIEDLARRASVQHLLDISNNNEGEVIFSNINAFGSFSNVLKFIYLLENSNYYLSIEKIQLTGGSSANSEDLVKAQMSVKVYTK